MDTPKKLNAGHTLIELTLAISLAGMLVGIVAVSYVTIYKGFFKQSSRMSDVQEMIKVKAEISGMMSRNVVLKSFSPVRINLCGQMDSTVHTIEFSNKKLKYDGEILSENATSFIATLADKPYAEGKYLLQWEVVFENVRWIGGSEFVNHNNDR
jgi:type II secretory pathway pseudopilin PulG